MKMFDAPARLKMHHDLVQCTDAAQLPAAPVEEKRVHAGGLGAVVVLVVVVADVQDILPVRPGGLFVELRVILAAISGPFRRLGWPMGADRKTCGKPKILI